MRDGLARLKGDRYLRRAEESPDESALDKLTRETIWRLGHAALAAAPRGARRARAARRRARLHRADGAPAAFPGVARPLPSRSSSTTATCR